MRVVIWATSAILLTGCGASSASLGPLRDALANASTLGATAQLALDGITSSIGDACTTVASACSTFPCSGSATVTLGASCPLPYGDVLSGSVQVTGMFTSADAATFSSTFVNVAAGARPFTVVSATSLTVTRSGTSITVAYDGQNVVTGTGIEAQQSTWTVVLDSGVTISGTDQTASLGAEQLSVTAARFDPSCRDNPTSGSAMLQTTSLTSIQQDDISFHSTCDGQVDVNSATGGTKSVAL